MSRRRRGLPGRQLSSVVGGNPRAFPPGRGRGIETRKQAKGRVGRRGRKPAPPPDALHGRIDKCRWVQLPGMHGAEPLA